MSLPKIVQDYMTAAPYTVPVDLPLEVASRFMKEKHIRHLPVLKDRAAAGILSDVSLMLARAGATTVGDVMEKAHVVPKSAPLSDIARGMANRTLGTAVVVVDDREKVCGIFTMVDALLVLARMLDDASDAPVPGPARAV